ncbi:hypothetical protein FB567DRAFT_450867 [Paraphoma chrysanthemicola]|uniref:PH domain-containing protein n=1 Tax=Paraphoma chrysanthemicola TaxID=798071 RepID=A0A8K0QZD3_9PLEO|nr:hypothetical protein FB567DRAFT_450867 [Paraphoma chrysanthemicola]
MEPATETSSQGRRNRSSNTPSSQAAPPTYGYHNTYHTHAQLPIGAPPSYIRANEPSVLKRLGEISQNEAEVARRTPLPPSYECTVELSGVLGVRQELSSPFQVAGNREWYDVFVVLQGTQLSICRVKQPGLLSKNRKPSPGRLIRTYTLQHAEIGVASDFKKTALTPKSPFAHLVPASARPKLYETDPHLFEPVREHVIRLRLETEQFLLCAPSQDSMLSWIESLCAAIDISSPLDDRSEPRYRSLPRRSRRQRILDSAQLGDNIDNLSSLEAGRRIIAQQEQIIRQLYPHLAASREPGSATIAPTAAAPELDIDEFDAEDVRFPSARSARDSLSRVIDEDDERPASSSTPEEDRKNADRIRPTHAQITRYRRRCAPVLLASSPRVSDVVFSDGKRMRINIKDHMLVEYTSHPPRYDAHHFPRQKRPAQIQVPLPPATKIVPVATAVQPSRPASPMRGVSDDSITSISFGEDLAPSASQSADDVSSSGPPSPTGISHGKADAARRIVEMGKRRSEDGRAENLTLGVPLLL